MKKSYLMYTIVVLLLCTGCSSPGDMFNTGLDQTSISKITQPYTNDVGYVTVNFDLKNVDSPEENILNEYDFSGPMEAVFNQAGTNNTNSTVIEAEEVSVTTDQSESINPNLMENAETGLCAPLENSISTYISSPFGPRTSPTAGASSDHKGIDLPVATGTSVYAIASGTVTVSQYSSSAGNYVKIEHDVDNGISASLYMHNSELIVKVGDHVEKGQIISRSGSTGYSTGPHLHIALLDSEGNYVNPVDYLPEFYSK